MVNELVNEITKYLDEHICPEDKIKDFCVYIWSKKNDNGEVVPEEYPYAKTGYSFWSIRYPGYTCGALIFNLETKEFDELILTRRGGGFSDHPTVFIDPDKLEKEVTEKFKGCKITYEKLYKDKDLMNI